MRFKPPPAHDSAIGWRVEFRPMDIQLTDFENCCLIVLMGLIVNCLNHFNLNSIIPITLADENMRRAHKRDAIINEKFWFNASFIQDENCTFSYLEKTDFLSSAPSEDKKKPPKYEEFYIYEILNGKEDSDFKGLMPVIRAFMKKQKYSIENRLEIEHCLSFLLARAKGDVPTGAKFLRDYIQQSPFYMQNSKLSPCLID